MDVNDTEGPSIAGSWLVEDIGGAAVLADARPAIQFGPDGAMSGTTGLNRFSGRYEVGSGQLHSSPLATTRMAGPPAVMEQEARFIAALAQAAALTFENATLTIGAGDHRLHLVRTEDDPAADSGRP